VIVITVSEDLRNRDALARGSGASTRVVNNVLDQRSSRQLD
jgi:hypothetical protein